MPHSTAVKVQIETIAPTRKKLTVMVPAGTIQQERSSLLEHYRKHLRIPGFRKGKVPASLIQKQRGEELAQKLKQKISSLAWEELRKKEHQLDICATLSVDGSDFSEDADAKLIFVVDVLPEFALPSYESFSMELPSDEPSEEEFERMKKSILAQRAEFEKVERAAKEGDYVKLSYIGSFEDKPLDELPDIPVIYKEQKQTWEEAGDENNPGIPAIVKGICGMASDEEARFEQTYEPEDKTIPEALRGKTIQYSVKVHEVREKHLPELNDALVKSFGAKDLPDWENRIRSMIKEQKIGHVESLKRQKVLEKLLEGTEKIPLPSSLVQQEFEGAFRQLKQHANPSPEATQATQATQAAQAADPTEPNDAALQQQAQSLASQRIRSDLIIMAIAKKEDIQLGKEDFQKVLFQQASAMRMAPEQLLKEVQKNPEKISALQHRALFEKTLAFLAQRVQAAKPATI